MPNDIITSHATFIHFESTIRNTGHDLNSVVRYCVIPNIKGDDIQFSGQKHFVVRLELLISWKAMSLVIA